MTEPIVLNTSGEKILELISAWSNEHAGHSVSLIANEHEMPGNPNESAGVYSLYLWCEQCERPIGAILPEGGGLVQTEEVR